MILQFSDHTREGYIQRTGDEFTLMYIRGIGFRIIATKDLRHGTQKNQGKEVEIGSRQTSHKEEKRREG